jgi:hypothetical protein
VMLISHAVTVRHNLVSSVFVYASHKHFISANEQRKRQSALLRDESGNNRSTKVTLTVRECRDTRRLRPLLV